MVKFRNDRKSSLFRHKKPILWVWKLQAKIAKGNFCSDLQHSTFNIQHSTFNIQHSTFNIQHSTFNIQHSIIHII